jgi:hypothetical protein
LWCGGGGGVELYIIGSIGATFKCINRLKVEIDLNIIKNLISSLSEDFRRHCKDQLVNAVFFVRVNCTS